MICSCCGSDESFEEAFTTQEISFSETVAHPVSYMTCGDCGMTEKSPFPSGLRAYYEENWQYPGRSHEDAALWIASTLSLHGITKLRRAFDVGSRDYRMLEDLKAAGVSILDMQISDPNKGGHWFGDGKVPKSHDCQFVSASHVLEHVEDIHRFMGDVESLMMSSGILFLEVPSPELETQSSENDDIARTHLRHFPLSALGAFMSSRGFEILRLDMAVGDGHANNRVLAQKGAFTALPVMQAVHELRLEFYREGIDRLRRLLPAKDVALYGFSDAYFKLWSVDSGVVEGFRVFDRYRHGSSLGAVTAEPLEALDVSCVILTSRQVAVVDTIKDDLKRSHPDLKVKSLWRGELNG
jgi:hypothetical protein